jgi:hypothetical protein
MSWNTAPMMPRTSTSGLQGARLVCTSERTPCDRKFAVTVDTSLTFGCEQLATSETGLDAPSSRLWHVARVSSSHRRDLADVLEPCAYWCEPSGTALA